jgi:hypothetical protein
MRLYYANSRSSLSSSIRSALNDDEQSRSLLAGPLYHPDETKKEEETNAVLIDRNSTTGRIASSTLLQWFGKTVLVFYALYGLLSMSVQIHDSLQRIKPTTCDCGSSVAEAISLGCKYDSLAAAWLPGHCRDDELTAEFETKGPGPNGSWIYWADRDHKIEVSLEEIAAMGDDPSQHFRMSWEWHKGESVAFQLIAKTKKLILSLQCIACITGASNCDPGRA